MFFSYKPDFGPQTLRNCHSADDEIPLVRQYMPEFVMCHVRFPYWSVNFEQRVQGTREPVFPQEVVQLCCSLRLINIKKSVNKRL